MADDVAARLGREEYLTGAAETDGVAVLLLSPGVETGVLQALPQSLEANQGLRVQGRRRFDRRDVAVAVLNEEQQLDPRRELVLATLPRDLDREGEAAPPHDAVDDRLCRLTLIGPQGAEQASRSGGHASNLSNTCATTVLAMKKRRPLSRDFTSARSVSRLRSRCSTLARTAASTPARRAPRLRPISGSRTPFSGSAIALALRPDVARSAHQGGDAVRKLALRPLRETVAGSDHL